MLVVFVTWDFLYKVCQELIYLSSLGCSKHCAKICSSSFELQGTDTGLVQPDLESTYGSAFWQSRFLVILWDINLDLRNIALGVFSAMGYFTTVREPEETNYLSNNKDNKERKHFCLGCRKSWFAAQQNAPRQGFLGQNPPSKSSVCQRKVSLT